MRPAPLPMSTGFRHGTLRRRLAQTSALAGMLAAAPGFAQLAPDALPTLPTPSLLVDTSGSTMTVTPVVPRTIINWSTYNIGTAATVEYVNPVGAAIVPTAVLNRVQGTGARPTTITESQILGTLRSADNISVYLVNQAGILFGPDAVVSVGSLVASTRDTDDNDFTNIANDTFRFTAGAAPDPALLVLDGSQTVTGGSTDPAGFIANNGIVAFIAARVATTGTITASNEVVMITANDTTLNLTPGSPLQITIAEGTEISTPMVLRGALNGSSVLVAAATRNSVTDGLLDITADMTATSASATDQGIVLAAGRTASLATNIIMPAGENAGSLGIRLGGTLTANDGVIAGTPPIPTTNAAIDVRARDGVFQPITAGPPPATLPGATLIADQALFVRADAGGVAIGDATGASATITAGAGDIIGGAFEATAGSVTVTAASGAATVAGLTSTLDGNLSASGIATLTGAALVAQDLVLSGNAGVRLGGATAVTQQAGRTASYTASAGTITKAAGATGLLTIRGDANPDTTAGAIILDAATGIDMTGTGLVTGDPLGSTNTGDIGIRLSGAAAPLTLGTVDARSLQSVNAAHTTFSNLIAPAAITLGATRVVETLQMESPSAINLTSVAVTGTDNNQFLEIFGNFTAGSTVTATGTLSAPAVIVSAQEAISLADVSGIGLLSIISRDAGVTAGALTGNMGIDARDSIQITSATGGNVGLRSRTGGLTVTGGTLALPGVVQFDAPGVIQTGDVRTNNSVTYQSSINPATGAITSGAVRAGSFVTANRAAGLTFASVTSDTGQVSLTAPGGIVTVTGATSAGATNGTLVISGASLALGAVTARSAASLTAATGGITASGAIRADGQLTIDAPGTTALGDVRSVNAGVTFQSTATPVTGALTAGAVQASGDLSVARATNITFGSATSDNGAVSLTASGNSLTVTGATTAAQSASFNGASVTLGGTVTAIDGAVTAAATAGNVSTAAITASAGTTVIAPGVVSVAAVAGGTGATLIESTGSTTTATGVVSGASVVARAQNLLSLTSVDATAGTAALTSTADDFFAGIRVTGDTQATGAVTVNALGPISMAGVRSTGGSVSFLPTDARFRLTAGAVRASTTLSISHDAGMILGSATSDLGSVILNATSGNVTVTGATTAAVDVTASGSNLQLGNVTATSGNIDLDSTTGTLNAGALQAGTAIDVFGGGGAGLASATASGGTLRVAADSFSVSVGTDGLLSGIGVTVTAPTVSVFGVAAGTGTATLEATTGNLFSFFGTSGSTISGASIVARAQGYMQLSTVNATAGTATLTATTGSIFVSQSTTATGAVTVSAPDFIRMGNVRSLDAEVSFLPANSTAPLTARAVQAWTDVTIARDAAVTLDEAYSVTGAVSMTSTSGRLSVNGLTRAATNVVASAPILSLGAVSAATGSIDLDSTGGTLTTGALDARTSIDVLGRTETNVASTTVRGTTVNIASSTSGVTVTGEVGSRTGATITAPGVVSVAGVAGGTGTATVESTGSTVTTTGALTGASVVASAQDLLSLASVEATAGTAALTSMTAGIAVTGATQASGQVTVSASDAITIGSVRSTGADIVFAPANGTGTVTAGAVQAFTGLSIARDAGFTLASATSDTGAITLRSVNGTAQVTGATTANGDVDIEAATVALGAVTSTAGFLDLYSDGTLTAGALSARGDVDAVGQTGVTLDSATSTASAIGLLGGTGTLSVTGALLAEERIDGFADGAITVGDVTSTNGLVQFRSSDGALTTGAVIAGDAALLHGQTDATFASVQAGDLIEISAGTGDLVTGALSAGTYVRAYGSNVTLGSVTALGSDFSVLSAQSGNLTVSGPVSTQGAIYLVGGSGITAGAVTSASGTAQLLSNSGSITAGALTGVDADAYALGDATLASITATGGAATLTASGDLTVTGTSAAQTDFSAFGGSVSLGAVTTTAGNVALRSEITGAVTADGSLNAGAVTANGSLTAFANTTMTLASAQSVTSTIGLTSVETLTVTGATLGLGDVAVTALSDAVNVRSVTSTEGTTLLQSNAASITAGEVRSNGLLTVYAQTDAALASATSDMGAISLTAAGDTLEVTGATLAQTDVGAVSFGAMSLAGVTATTRAVTLRSENSTVDVTSIDAGTNIDVDGRGNLTLGTLNARGTVTGGSGALVSREDGISVASVTTRTTLAADAFTTLTLPDAAVGTDASLAGFDVVLGTIEAGTLQATARGDTLSVAAGDIRGAATLITTGATGEISIDRLNAVGPTQITSAGAVRADLLQGGATTVTAAGDVSGRTGGLGATVSLLTVDAGGIATIGVVTTTGNTSVATPGAALLTDTLSIGGNLVASGGTVTLGNAGQTIAQTAAGSVQVTSTSGAITGIAGLTLRSDSGGAGGGTRDLTLESAGVIGFAPGTLLAGGTDRQSALRLAAGPTSAITLDTVEARTIASPGTATSLAHTGPVSIARAAARDSLTIALAGGGNPALTIATTEVRAGNLSLDASGALTTGTVTVAQGTTTLAGATVNSGAIATQGLTANARTGGATFTTIDATAGPVTATAATDLRVERVNATGAIALTSTDGDITGGAVPGGFGAATLTGGSVTLRANAIDGTRGVVRLGAVSGTGGVDIAGRMIAAESLAAAAGAVTASTARNAAGITDQAISIGTIDASGAISLATGNRTVASTAPIALDRATSTGGPITITTIGGGLAARAGSPRTILSAGRPITLDIDGAAVLGSASGSAATIAATSLDVTTATATGGALALTTRGGPLLLGTGRATEAVMVDAAGAITATTIAGASASLTGIAGATLGTVQTSSGDLGVTVAGALDAATLDSARAIAVDAGSARITTADARGGALTAITRTGALRIDTGRASTDAILTAPTLSLGTLDTGGAAALTASGAFTADRLTIGTTLTTSADTATIATLTAGGDTRVTGTTRVDIGAAGTPGTLTLAGRRIEVTNATAGALDAAAGADGLDLRTGTVTRAATVRSDGPIAIGTLDAGVADLTAATTIVANRLATTGTLSAAAGTDATLTAVSGGGATTLDAVGRLTVTAVTTPATLALNGGTVAVTTLDAGALDATAGAGGLDLRTGRVTNAASLTSAAGLGIGSLTAGSAALDAATTIVADTLATGDTLVAAAGADATYTGIDAGGDARLTAGGTLTIASVETPAALVLDARSIAVAGLDAGSLAATAGVDGIDLRTGTVTGAATIGSDGGIAIGSLDSGSAAPTAAAALTADTLVTRTTLTAAAGSGATFGSVTAGGDASLSAVGVLTIGSVDAASALALTGDGVAVTTLDAGSLALTAGVSGANLGIATVVGPSAIDSGDDVTIGTLDTGTGEITAAGAVVADRIAARAGLNIDASTTRITETRVSGGATRIATGDAGLILTDLAAVGDVELRTTGVLTAETLDIGGRLTAEGASASFATTRVTGDAALSTTGGGLVVRDATIDGAAMLAAAGDVTVDTIGTGGDLMVDAGGVATLTTATVGGDARVTATTIAIGSFTTPQALALTADRIDVTTIGAGSLVATAGAGGAALGEATVTRDATIDSGGDLTIGTLDTGTGEITAAGAVVADLIAARAGLSIDAATTRITETRVTGGVTRIATGDAGLILTDLAAAGDVELRTTGVLTTETLDIGGQLIGEGASASFATTRVTGDAAVSTTSGGLVVGNATIGGAAALAAVSDVTVDTIGAGGGLTVDAGGVATLTTASAGGDSRVMAAAIAIGSFATPQALALTADRIDVTTIGAGTLAAMAGAGGAAFGEVTVTRDATIDSGGGLTITRLASDTAAFTAAGSLDAGTLAITRTLVATAGGDAAIGQADAGGDASLTAAGTLILGRLATPAQATLAARRIDAATIAAGGLNGRAGIGGAAYGRVLAASVADLGSGADLAIGTLSADSGRLAAVGTLNADAIAARAGLIATAADAAITSTTVSGGSAALNTTAGNLAIGEIATAGALDLAAAQGLVVGRANAGGALTATAASGALTTIRVTGNTAITARGGDVTLGSATVGGAATLTASGRVAAEALDVVGNLLGEAAAIRVATTTVRTGGARLSATGGGIALGTATIAGDTGLTATGLIDAGTIAAGRTLAATGGSIAFRRASAGAATTLTARDAGVALGEGRFAAEATLTARTALTADLLTVGTTLGGTADSIALTNATIGRDATLGVREIRLGTLGSGGALTLTAAGPLNATTLDVGGRFVTTAAALTLGTATVRGGDAALTVGSADIGAMSTSTGTRVAATGAFTANRLDAGTAIDIRAASAAITQASARGGDTIVTATAGDIRVATASATGAVGLTSTGATGATGAVTAGGSYRIDAASIALGATGATARQAGADVTLLARTGAITGQGSTILAGTRAVGLTARGATGAITFAPDTTITSSATDVVLATTGAAALGTVTASAGAIRLDAADAVLTRPVAAQNVTLTNVATTGVTRLGDTAIGNETEFGASTTRFDLANTEIGLVSAPTVTIASGARDVAVGAIGLAVATGSTRFAITATGRVDMLGRFVAAGSTASRTITVGSDTPAGRTGVIRLAATQADGGRLLVDGAVLELTADRIGAGLDRDFLDTIGYRTATGLEVEQVTREFVARPTSTLYQPSALGAQPYTDAALVRSGTLRLTYGRYALFQNTGLPSEQTGVVIGTLGAAAAPGGTLRLSTPNSTANAFALFGTIDGISSQATALLGPERLSIDTGVSPVASRINGCVIGSGGGCLNTSIAQPTLNLFDTSRAEIVRTADDLTLPFDPLIGTNNEALYLDSETIAAAAAAECEGDKPCSTKP